MFTLSPIKILVIVAAVLILLGPDKLPEVAHKLGSWWRTLKNLQSKVESEVRQAIPDLPSAGEIARVVRSPVNLLNQLADRVEERESAPDEAVEDETSGEGETEGSEESPYEYVDDGKPLITTVEHAEESADLTDFDEHFPPDPSLN